MIYRWFPAFIDDHYINTIIYLNHSAQAFVQGRGQLRFAQRSELPEAGMRMWFYHVLPCFTRILKHKHQAWWKSKLQTTGPEMTRATQDGWPTLSLLQKKLAMKKARQVSSSRHLSGICLSRKRMDLFTAISSKDLWISLGVHRVGPLSSYIMLYPALGWGPALTPAFCFTLFYIVHSLLVAHSWNAELHWLSSLHLLGYSSCKCVGNSRSRFPAVAWCCCSICCGGAANFHLDDVKICQMMSNDGAGVEPTEATNSLRICGSGRGRATAQQNHCMFHNHLKKINPW